MQIVDELTALSSVPDHAIKPPPHAMAYNPVHIYQKRNMILFKKRTCFRIGSGWATGELGEW
jgi:hypothetical protein